MKDLKTDTRIQFLKIHIGVRTHLNPKGWKFGLPYPPRKWWFNPYLGPIELTFWASWKLCDWFASQTAMGVHKEDESCYELRLHPFSWHLRREVNSYGRNGRWDTTSIWIGPVWIYTRTLK